MDQLDALYDAAIAGDAAAIAKLEAEAINEYEQTILHIESYNGNTERVRFILKQFAHKNLLVKLDSDENTPLIWASFRGHTEVVQVLIDAARQLPNDDSVPSSDDDDNTPENPVTSFQAFLRQGDENRNTALHLAVEYGFTAIVKLLVEADPSDTHFQNRVGKTPMYLAAEEGHNDIAHIIFTTCTAPSLDGPDGSTVVRVENLDPVKNSSETLYKIVDKDDLYAAAIAGDADAIAKLEMQADKVMNAYGGTILHAESREGNTDHVRFILREFAHKNLLVKLGNQRETALTWAAYYGHIEVVEILMDEARRLPHPSDNDTLITSFQAFLRHVDQDSETALHSAVKKEHPSIVKLLVEADPSDAHIQNNEGKTPMYIAAEEGYNDIAHIIFTTCTAPSFDGPDGSTVVPVENLDQATSTSGTFYKIMDRLDILYDAAIAGDAAAIAKLEIETDKLNEHGETILHVESERGNTERVRFILKEFANKNLLVKSSNYKSTALHLALYQECTEVAEILIDAAKHLPVTSFHDFLRQGDKDMDTALHTAVMNRNVAIVKLLVEADPTDRHIINDDGKTPMFIAVERGFNDIVEIISTTCIAPSLDGPYGSTALRIRNLEEAKSPGEPLYKIMDKDALYAAAMAGDADATAILEMKADRLNKDEETILHVESKKGNTEHVRYILREFAHKNLLVKQDNQKETALTWAAYFGHTEVAQVLIEAARHLPPSANDAPVTSFQAFLRLGDKDMDTALHIAVINNKIEIVKLLVEADPSDMHKQNNEGKTPIYIAVEKGYYDIVKLIGTSCTPPLNLNGPGASTVLHVAIKNLDQAKKEDRDVIGIIINAVKSAGERKVRHGNKSLLELFSKVSEDDRCTVLELAVERNYVDVVKVILAENPAYQLRIDSDLIGLVPLIYKAMDKEYTEIFKLLTECYERETVSSVDGDIASLISAIRTRKRETVLSMLANNNARELVNFADNLGWTALHHAAYHKFDAIIYAIVEAQKKFGHKFGYQNMVSTPFHVAAEKGYTSIVLLLMQLWPSSSSSYTVLDKNGKNILHIAALQSKKEMIEGILKYCPQEYKNKFVNEGDKYGNTPLHLLISRGCLVAKLLRYEGIKIRAENKEKWTPPDMLYFEDEIIADQVQIKIALDGMQIDPTGFVSSSSVLSSKRERKDAIFRTQAESMKLEKYARIKEDTQATANCFAEAIAGDPISKAALELKAGTPNESGETILHVESKKGYIENVRFILTVFAKKSLLGKKDGLKQTALHHAVDYGHTQVVEVLIDAAKRLPSSANDDAHNPASSFLDFIRQANVPNLNTALHLAVLSRNVSIVKLLIEADPNDSHVQNIEGKTPIYIAAENGYKEIIMVICTTCSALCLDGPAGRTTALHALIQTMDQVTEEAIDVIRMMVHAAKRWSSADDPSLFSRTDDSRRTSLQLALERNYVDVVKLILPEDPAYQSGGVMKRNNLMLLICEAIDKKYSNDIVELLSKAYEDGIDPDHKGVLALILDIRKRDEDSVLRKLKSAKKLVTFEEDNGWTPLHYALYHEFDSILDAIIEAQEEVEHQFVCANMVSTPFHVAVRNGHTSTVIRLMQLWPTPTAAQYSPYTIVDENGQNILHLASANNNKEMVRGILKHCPEEIMDEILIQQDIDGNTPLHLLICHGCYIPELIKYEELNKMARNKNNFTPRDMLYFKNDIVADQAQIKIALDEIQTNQSRSFLLRSMTNVFGNLSFNKRNDIRSSMFESFVLPSRRVRKDAMFDEQNKLLMEIQMEKKLEIYRQGTNSQIVVSALITTITFTVAFTMPGGLHQDGEDEGLVVLSKKAAFNAFMVVDALALLLSTCSMFIYFLQSMYKDPREVMSLHRTTTALNIVSVMLMMLIFITGTYVVLSHTPALAITVCVIGSLFFLFAIVHLMKVVQARESHAGRRKKHKV